MEDREELEGVPEPGDVILGKFRVDRVLGVGGMGCVVAATHTTLDQPVAIKFLLSSAAKNPKNIHRFTREAQAAAKIKSDHVAKVSDVGTLPTGVPYMVMEYLDGEDLADRIARGPIEVTRAASFMLEACEALAEAHAAGIIHRDLKPANLFVARAANGEERIKVLDFGISKIVAEPGKGADLTKTSTLMGSPLYMSPEQMTNAKAADHRTDIWALGCILFECLTAQPPFIGTTLPEICSKILTRPPTPMAEVAPHIPPALTAVVERCLTKEPDERYASLNDLAHDLAPFAGEMAARSVAVISGVLGMPNTLGRPAAHGYHASGGSGAFAAPSGSVVAARPAQQSHAQMDPTMAGASLATSDPALAAPGYHGMAAAEAMQQGAITAPPATQPAGPLLSTGSSSVDGAPGYDPAPAGQGSGMFAQPAVTSPSHPPAPAAYHQLGASTAAPVAQTHNEEPPKSKTPLVVAALVLLVGGGLGAVAFGTDMLAGDDPGAAPAALSETTDPAAANDDAGDDGTNPDDGEASDATEGDARADGADDAPDGVDAVASATATPAKPGGAADSAPGNAVKPAPKGSVPPVVPAAPQPPQPPATHKPKPGDSLFNR